jgi:hypothetical protein
MGVLEWLGYMVQDLNIILGNLEKLKLGLQT